MKIAFRVFSIIKMNFFIEKTIVLKIKVHGKQPFKLIFEFLLNQILHEKIQQKMNRLFKQKINQATTFCPDKNQAP